MIFLNICNFIFLAFHFSPTPFFLHTLLTTATKLSVSIYHKMEMRNTWNNYSQNTCNTAKSHIQLTCSKPPSSSVVSIELFIGSTHNEWPVSLDSSLTRVVLPLDCGPTCDTKTRDVNFLKKIKWHYCILISWRLVPVFAKSINCALLSIWTPCKHQMEKMDHWSKTHNCTSQDILSTAEIHTLQ